MTTLDRWHLGEVLSKDGTEPDLSAGIPCVCEGPLRALVTHPGRALEFCLTSFVVPIASKTLACEVSQIAQGDVQCVPVAVEDGPMMMVLNSVRVVRCVDESRSEFTKWTLQDHRADLAGQYRSVSKLVLDVGLIPADAHFFRVEGWPIGLIVSEAVKTAMERSGCVGATFVDVTPAGLRPN